MKSSKNKFLVPALLVSAIVVVAFNTVLAINALNRLDLNQAMVEHTWMVINDVEQIMSSSKDAETGSRGFLITNDDSYPR